MNDPTRRTHLAPWSPHDLFHLYVTNVVGLTFLVLGWWAASGEAALPTQVSWFSIAVLGVSVSGFGDVLFLAVGRRHVVARRTSVLLVPDSVGSFSHDTAYHGPLATPANGSSGDHVVSGAGMTAFHRQGCPLVSGKAVAADRRDSFEQAGRKACPICKP